MSNLAAVPLELATLQELGFADLGYETKEEDGLTYVKSLWCKVCHRQGQKLKTDPRIRGICASSADGMYLQVVIFTGMYNIDRSHKSLSLIISGELLKKSSP